MKILFKHIELIITSATLITSITFQSCGSNTKVVRTAELKDGNVKGPINYPPVFITSAPRLNPLKISPHFEITPNRTITAKVGSQASSIVEKPNFTWAVSKVTGGFNINIDVSNEIALTGSMNLSSNNNLHGSAGISFFNYNNIYAFRLDGGILFNSFYSDAHSVVDETISGTFYNAHNTYYFHDKGNSSSIDFYVSLTVNSTNKDNFLNYFLNIGYFRQSELDYNPGNYDEGYYTESNEIYNYSYTETNNTNLKYSPDLIYIYPGIYFNIFNHVRLIAGSRILLETTSSLSMNKVFFAPALQMELSL